MFAVFYMNLRYSYNAPFRSEPFRHVEIPPFRSVHLYICLFVT